MVDHHRVRLQLRVEDRVPIGLPSLPECILLVVEAFVNSHLTTRCYDLWKQAKCAAVGSSLPLPWSYGKYQVFTRLPYVHGP